MAKLPAHKDGLQQGLDNYTLGLLLAANVPELFTVPTDDSGVLAKYVKFGTGKATTDNFYAQAFNEAQAADRATNGTFAEYVTNGAFASDTGWTKGTGWTIAAGVATATGAISTALSQTSAITLIAGFTYTITYTVTRTAGTVTPSIGGTAGTARSTNATFVETIVAGTTQLLAFTGASFSGTIDNVSVTAWGLGTGWTTDGATAIATGAISTDLSQTANAAYPLVAGQTYLCTHTATRAAGDYALSLGGGTAGATVASSVTTTEVLTAGSTQAILFDAAGFTGTIDTVSIIPCAKVPGDITTGLASIQNPEGFFLGGNATKISVVSAATPIVTASFFK